MRIENYNNDFILIQSKEAQQVQQIGRNLFERKPEFVEEVIVSEYEICLKLQAGSDIIADDFIQEYKHGNSDISKNYQLPVWFDEEGDWNEILSQVRRSRTEIIEKLVDTNFTLAMFGFLPGFCYLNGLKKELHTERKQVPSKRVAANSVALGGKYLGIYAIESPGGWNVIGKTPLQLLNLTKLPPTFLKPGDQIQVISVSKSEFDAIKREDINFENFNK